jgi:peptidoglycan/LPS O-acetylase OafA/YrhL
MQYRPEIDGLRAFAIIPVVLYHAGVFGLSGGFAGVDVFFVISGYLITSIILSERQAGTFTLWRFYQRRIRRIMPAMFFVLVVAMGLAWFLLLPKAMEAFGRSLLGVLTFSSNHHFFKESGYFDVSSDIKPLLHTWSLAVEEQFYIFFPLLFMALIWLGRTAMMTGLLVLVGASLIASQLMLQSDPSAAFFLLPSRAWELGLGCLVGLWLFGCQQGHSHQAASFFGLCMVMVSFIVLDAEVPFPGVNALLPTVGTCLVILFAGRGTWAHWLLSRQVLVVVGLSSYSLYLWHSMLFAFVRYRLSADPSVAVLSGVIVLSVGLAIVSYRLVETPFRQNASMGFVGGGAILGLAFVAIASFGYSAKETSGFPSRFDVPAFVQRAEFAFPDTKNGWCFYSVDSEPELEIGAAGQGCDLGDPDGPINALLVGDSFAGQYEPFWDAVGKDAGIKIRSVTTNWCFPSLTDRFPGPDGGRADAQCQSNRAFLQENAADYDIVILGGNWAAVAHNGWLEDVSGLLAVLATNPDQIQIMMPSPPQTAPQSVEAAAYGVGPVLDGHSRSEMKAQSANTALLAIVEQVQSARFLSRDMMFSNGAETSQYTSEGKPFSLDGAHISIYGAQTAAKVFLAGGFARTFLEAFD